MRGRSIKPKARTTLRRRMLAKTPIILAALALVAVAASVPFAARAAYRFIAARPVFAITDVRVTGLKYVRRDDFLSYMGNPRGGSILTYDIGGALRKAVLHPWIKTAVVRRDFPHSVRFEFTERIPAATAETGSGSYLVDNEGFAIAKVDGQGWEFLPVIEYPSAHGLKEYDADTSGALKDAIELLKAARNEPSERLSGARVTVADNNQPCLLLDGTLIKVGQGGYAEKMRRLSEVAQDIRKRGANPSLIDLRFPGKVVVRES